MQQRLKLPGLQPIDFNLEILSGYQHEDPRAMTLSMCKSLQELEKGFPGRALVLDIVSFVLDKMPQTTETNDLLSVVICSWLLSVVNSQSKWK